MGRSGTLIRSPAFYRCRFLSSTARTETFKHALVGVNLSASTRHANDWSGIVLAQYPSKDAFDQPQEGGSLERVLRDCERSHVHGLRRPAHEDGCAGHRAFRLQEDGFVEASIPDKHESTRGLLPGLLHYSPPILRKSQTHSHSSR